MRKFYVLALLLCFGWMSVVAQSTANYTFSTNATSSLVLDRNSNTVDMSAGTTTLVVASADATASAVTNIGFDFFFLGIRYNQFSVNDDGMLQLGGTAVATNTYVLTTGTAAAPRLSAFVGDLRTGSSGKIHSKVIGTAPNRTLVVEFNNMQLFYTTATAGSATWQMRFYESTGVIEYVYGAMSVSDVTTSASSRAPGIGFYTGSATGAFGSVLYASNTYSSTTPYAANPTITATGNITNLNSAADGSRRNYTFIPPGNATHATITSLANPTALSVTAPTLSGMTLSWTAASPTTGIQKYAIYNSTDGVNYTYFNTVNIGTNTFAATGLTAATTYFWRVYSVSEGYLGTTPATGSGATGACSISGTKTIGATGADYTSIASALTALTNNGVAGPVILELLPNYVVESNLTFPLLPCASATNTITIRPSSAVTAPFVFTSATANTFNINGGRYYIIDGRPGGAGSNKYITITNTNASGPAVQFTNDAANNIIRNCTITSANTTGATGTIVFSATATTLGNSNNTIDVCDILDGTATPLNAIYSSGLSTTVPNTGNTVSNSNIANYYSASSSSKGIFLAASSAAWTITGNRFYQTSTRTGSSQNHFAIEIITASGGGYTINNNIIGYANNAGTGTTTYSSPAATVRFVGIDLQAANTPVSNIQGNTIANFNISSNSGGSTAIPVFAGITVQSGGVNIGSTTANTIGAASGTNSIVVSAGTAPIVTGIYVTSTGTVAIQNNIISSVSASGTAALGSTVSGIQVAGSGVFTVTGNTIGGTTANSFVAGTVATTTATTSLYGIQSSVSGTPLNINSNTVNNIRNYSSGTSSLLYAVYNTGSATTLNMNSNVVTNNNLTAGAFWGVYSSGSGTTANLNSNQVNNNTNAGIGTSYLVYGGTPTTLTASSNILNNNTMSGASGILYCIAAGTTQYTFNANQIYNNIFSATSGTGAAVLHGIYDLSSPTSETVTGNIIHDLTIAGSSTSTSSLISGIYTNTTTGTKNFSGNTIYTLNFANSSTGAATLYGIFSASSSPNIYKNKIYDISAAGAGSISYGIYVSSGATVNIYNNIVGDIFTPSGTQTAPTVSSAGIYIASAATTVNVYYNTINISGTSSGANWGTAAFYANSTPTVTSRNNIFVNTAVAKGTGKSAAYQRSTATLTTYGSASNNNLYYAGTPSAGNVLFYDGTNSDQTLTDLKTRMTPRDAVSISEMPPFLSTTGSAATYLHINTAVATQIESGGAPIATYTDDFDGDTRNATTPDIGADEFVGTPSDLTPPTIVYTPLASSCTGGARTLTATITDASGVPTSGIGLPVAYFRINAGAYAAVQGVSIGSNQYTFNIGTGSTTGDVVSYYIVAQDNVGTPNVGAFPATGAAGFTANPPAAATAPTSPSSYSVLTSLAGTYSVGATNLGGEAGHFATLTAAVAAYNSSCVSGAVNFVLMDATYSASETFPITINANVAASSTNRLNIYPNAGVTATISGAVASGTLIKILGSYVYFNGSNNASTTKDLTITNTSATSPSVFWIGSTGAGVISNVEIKNTIIVNGANTSSAIAVSDGASTSTGGNFTNITIQNNMIQRAYNGIFIFGATTAGNGAGLLITGNDMSASGANSVRLTGISVTGVDGASTISNNIISNIANANAEYPRAISLSSGVNNCTVSGNTISSIVSTATGAYTVTGIYIGSTAPTSIIINNNNISSLAGSGSSGNLAAILSFSPNTNITNNTISGITQNYSSGNSFYGIIVSAVSNGNISGNTISGLTTNTSGTASGIYVSGATTGLNIFNNRVSNIKNTNTSGFGSNGIYLSSSSTVANIKVYNNFVSDVASNGYASGATLTDNGYGIVVNGGAGYSIDYNTVSLATNQGTAGISAAINITSGVTASGAINLRNNIFSNTQTNVTTTGYAIYSAASSTVFGTINNNDYYSAGTNIGYINSIARADIAAVQLGFGQNTNSVKILPVFTSATDLHLVPASNITLDNLGVAIAGITTDIDGDTRSASTPDMGADEFTAPACTGATGGTASAPTVTYCASGTPTITATGYSVGSTSTYQWQSATDAGFTTPVDIASQTNPATLTLPGAVTSTTYYRLKVTCGATTSTAFSNVITITINPAITASISPSSPAAVCAPATVTLTATTSAVTPTYAWFLNGTTSVGTNSATYAAPVSGNYTVRVTDATTCNVTSSAVTVTINAAPLAPTITPSSPQNICAGSIVTLSATSGATPAYPNENFNTVTAGTLPSGWSSTGTNALSTWGTNATANAGGVANEMRLNCTSAGSADNGTWALVLPSFSATAVTGISASFKHKLTNYDGSLYPYTLNFQTSPDGAAWTTRWTVSAPASTDINAGTVTVPLTAIDGQATVYTRFALIGRSFGAVAWYIDDVVFTGTAGVNTITWSPNTDLYTDAGATIAYTGTAATTVYAKPAANTTYTATATSGSSCTNTSTIVVNVNTIAASATHTDVLCFGGTTGTITASGTGGTAPYQYALNAGAYQVSPNFTGLAAGTYTVHVKDNNGTGCDATTTVVIAQPASAVTVSTTSPVNPLCHNGTTGSFTAVGSGGAGGFTYSLDNFTYQPSGLFTGLSGGTPYTVYAKDANGCTGFTNITLTNPPLITVSASNNGPVCEGGSVTLTGTGGTSYVWSGPNSFTSSTNPVTINPIALAGAGTYSVLVTDANGCSNTATTNVVVNATVPVSVTLANNTGTSICSGVTVTYTATPTNGGSNPLYTFNVNGVDQPQSTSPTLVRVTTGNDVVFVKLVSDVNCGSGVATSNTITMNVTASVAASVSILADNNPVCAGTPVTITATAVGGGSTPNFEFFKGAVSVQNGASNTYTYTPVNGDVIRVVMTSSLACATGSPATSSNLTMTVNPVPSAPTITPSGPLTFCAGGSVTLTSSYAGSGNTWSNGATTSSIVVTTPGTYTVTYFDGNCTSPVSASVVVTVNPIPAAPTVTAGTATTFCAGGSVTLTSSYTTGNVWSNGATTQSITVTTGGSYTVTYFDGNCTSASSTPVVVTVTPAPVVTASASCTTVFPAGATTITASATGTGTLTYQWFSNTTNANTGGTSIGGATAATYNPPTATAGTVYYYVQVTGTSCMTPSNVVPITVTNGPLNGTYAIGSAAGCTGFPTIASAISYLNTNGLNGPVIFNVQTGLTETTPAGGFVIGGTGSAIVATGAFPTSSTNTVVFNGGNSVITAANNHTTGSLSDAVFKLVGADWITLKNFTMQENPANTVATTASNTMTEFGVALLYASLTDGAQNNTIASNTISLNRTYTNTIGIYSNTRHSATAPTVTAEVTAASGSNSFNKVYTNAISNVNFGITFIGAGTTLAAIDNGNDIGGASSVTGNTITNWGGGSTASAYVALTTSNYCIYSNQQINENISYNTITSASGLSVGATQHGGIFKAYSVASPTTGTITTNINNNTVSLAAAATSAQITGITTQGLSTLSTATININNNLIYNSTISGAATSAAFVGVLGTSAPGTLNINGNTIRGISTTATSGAFVGIQQQTGGVVTALNINNNKIGDAVAGAVTFANANSGGVTGIAVTSTGAAATCAVSITGNDFRGIVHSVAGTGGHLYISNAAVSTSQNISNNTFTNLVVNTTGSITFISNSVSAPAAGFKTINGNSIVTGFNKTGAGGTITLYGDGGSSTSTAGIQNNNNNFSNITVTGATTINGWVNNDGTGATPQKTITGNTFSNWTSGTSAITALQNSFGGSANMSNNTVTNITGQGAITGISQGTSGTIASLQLNNNTITGLSSTGTGGTVIGLSSGSPAAAGSISTNTINNLSTTGASSSVTGLINSSGTAITITANMINTLSGSGATSPVATGMNISGGTTVNVFKNKIYDIAETGAIGTTAAAVNGITLSGGTTVNTYNNLIGDLRAPSANLNDAIRGINITSTTATSNQNVSFNTVYLAASSTGTNFGSTGIFHTFNTTATTASLTLRNNIIVNKSTANGTGLTVAFRRSAATNINNYNTASNNNAFYAGTPGTSNLIYSDGTNTDQTLAAFKTRMGSADQLSVTEDVTFLSTAGSNTNFLHIDPAVPTQLESGAVPVAGITDDYDGETRSTSTPDIGADEFVGIPIDQVPPAITYTPLGAACATGTNVTLTATITDASGVPTSGSGLPMLYYKVNAGAYIGVQGVSIGSNQYTFTFGNTTTAAGDVVSYYIVAQDNAGTPNVTAFPVGGASGFTANPPAAATPPTTPSTFTVTGTLAGTYLVGAGPGRDFPTLTAAVAAYNTRCLSGAVIFKLTDATYPSETFPIVINSNTYANSTNTLTIRPETGVSPVITGSNNTAIIQIAGGKYVTIDGSNAAVNGTSRDMTIANTNTTGSTIRFTNGAANSTVKNAVLTGVTTSTANAVVLIGAGVTAANTNITVQNNSITKGATLPAYGVQNAGTAGFANSNVVITGNSIYDFSARGITDGGNSTGIIMSGNKIYGTANQATSNALVGIFIGATTITSPTITGNLIYDLKSTYTSTTAGLVVGIQVNDQASGSTTVIANNMVSLYGSGAAPGALITGILDEATAGSTVNTYYNSVSISGTFTSAVGYAYYKDYTGVSNVRNNIFSNTANNINYYQYAIRNYNTGTFSSNYNDLYSTDVIGNWGSTNYPTFANWQAIAGSPDANSISADPLFVSVNDLHVLNTSPVNNLATPIAGITTDYDGETRSATTPDIGADEFTPLTNDAGIIAIAGPFCPGGPSNVNATIKNYGVATLTSATINWSVNGVPQAPFAWTGSIAPNGTLSVVIGTFSFAANTTYTIVASTSNPNGSADGNTANDAFTLLNGRTGLSGNYNVGTGGDFTTLTSAITAANNYGLCGPATFLLTNTSYTTALGETFPMVINQLGNSSAVNTLTIKPAPSVTASITAASNILKFNGADYIVIDGSNTTGGTTRNLTLQTTAAADYLLWLASENATNGATNNKVFNTNFIGNSNTGTFGGIISSGSTVGGVAEAANSNNIYQNNSITTVYVGIAIVGPTGNEVNNQVLNNNLGSTVTANKLGRSAIELYQQKNAIVSGNAISGVTTASSTTTSGIAVLGTADGIEIMKNTINDVTNTNSLGYGANGVNLSSTLTTAGVKVTNNFISNITATGYSGGRGISDNGYGIVMNTGGGYDVRYNTVRLLASQTNSGNPAAINITSGITTAGSVNIVDNIFVNAQTQTGQRYAILSTAAANVFGTINYNDYVTTGTNLGYIASTDRPTLAAIIAGFGGNANSVNIAPVFVSATNHHLDPSVNVTLDNIGTPIAGVTDDIDGDIRNTITPDMGADEFSACSATMYTWTGKTNTDWNEPTNWCANTVPTAAIDVMIRPGVPNLPVLGTGIPGAGRAKDVSLLTVNTTASDLTIAATGTLEVSGNFVNNAKFSNNGTIRLVGSTLQTFPGTGQIGTNNDMYNLEVSNTGAGVRLTKTFGITNELKPTRGNLELDAFDVNIRSTATYTAHVAAVGSSATFSYNGIGRFSVERFINTGDTSIPNSGHARTWQFLSVPTTKTATGTYQSINDAWQEGQAAGVTGTAGLGTRISSPRFTTVGPTAGFDEGLATAGPGMKSYLNSIDQWDGGPLKTADSIANPKGWMVFVRGDRSVSGANAPTSSTTLRTRGTLFTGTQPDITVPANKYESIGNPYASSIDLRNLTKANLTNEIYIWDPTLGGTFGFGRYRVLTLDLDGHYHVSPTGGIYPGPIVDTIQSGQAFFVKSNGVGTSTIAFGEDAKVGGSNLVNRDGPANQNLGVNLSVMKANGNAELLDGGLVFFNNIYSRTVDAQDGTKILNSGENVGFRRDNKLLSVERMPLPVANDTIHLDLISAKKNIYNWQFVPYQMAQPERTAWLVDKYTNTNSPIDLVNGNVISFTVDANAASYATDRFKIVFKITAALPVTITTVKADRNPDRSIAVSWKVENEINIEHYEVERSADGLNFNGIITTASTNNRSYTKNDLSPLAEDNYYRIKAVSVGGQIQYSNVVKVAPLKSEGLISIYPNPVEGKVVHVRFKNMPAGTYQVELTSKLGQVLYRGNTVVTGANFEKGLTLDKSVAAGTYQMHVTDAQGKQTIIQVVVQ